MGRESSSDHWKREELEMFEKLFGLLSSDNDGEALTALRMVKKKLAAKKITWIQFTQRLARNAFGMVCSESSYSQQSSSQRRQSSPRWSGGPFEDLMRRAREEMRRQTNRAYGDAFAQTRRRGESSSQTQSNPNYHKDPFDYSAGSAGGGSEYGTEEMDDGEKAAWNSGPDNDGFSNDDEGMFQEFLESNPEAKRAYRQGSSDWKSRVRRTWRKKHLQQQEANKKKAAYAEQEKRKKEYEEKKKREQEAQAFVDRMRAAGQPEFVKTFADVFQGQYNVHLSQENLDRIRREVMGDVDNDRFMHGEEFLEKLRRGATHGVKVDPKIFKGGL